MKIQNNIKKVNKNEEIKIQDNFEDNQLIIEDLNDIKEANHRKNEDKDESRMNRK